MNCARCQHLESELNRLEGAQAEMLEILQSNGSDARVEEYNRIRSCGKVKRDLSLTACRVN